jgi:chromosome segregation ATPase
VTEAGRVALLAAIVARRRLLRDVAARTLAGLESRQASLRATASQCRALLQTQVLAAADVGAMRSGATLRGLLFEAAADGEERIEAFRAPIAAARAELASAEAALRAAQDALRVAQLALATARHDRALSDLPPAPIRRSQP